MIMSGLAQVEMSSSSNGKIFSLEMKGGYLDQKGHYQHERQGAAEGKHNPQGSG